MLTVLSRAFITIHPRTKKGKNVHHKSTQRFLLFFSRDQVLAYPCDFLSEKSINYNFGIGRKGYGSDTDIEIRYRLRLWNFKTRDTKQERFLHKNQLTKRKLLNFKNWTNGEPQQLAKSEFFKLIILIFHKKIEKLV